MGKKSGLATFILVAINLMCAPTTYAAAPGVSDYVWNEPTLSLAVCVDRA